MPFPENNSPFNLSNHSAYEDWRKNKLEQALEYTKSTPPHFSQVFEQGLNPTQAELDAILAKCKQNNFCLYRITDHAQHSADENKKRIHALTKKLGVSKLDNNICADTDRLTSITQKSQTKQHQYIPYSNKRLSWHTDGYYNLPENRINTMLLHCQQTAKEGGESLFMDHEIAYILLRDENPAFIEALQHPKALTIPANILNGKVIREAQTGPVFSLNAYGTLHMRYSARKRNIEWRENNPTLEAVTFLESLLTNDNNFIVKHTLQAGEGIICRNILHCRTAFQDFTESEKKRLLFRGRFYDELPY